MKLCRSAIAVSAVVTILLSTVPLAHARNASPRGFKRSISRAREQLKTECIHKEDANERRACIKEYRDTLRSKATTVQKKYVERTPEQRNTYCENQENTKDKRACMKNTRATSPRINQRAFDNRTRSRSARNRRDECRGKKTTTERLQCLRGASKTLRTQSAQPMRRNRLRENTPVNFISPQGLRRNLSRSRDLIRKQCDDIQDGNKKRACMKNLRDKHQGY